MELFERVQFIIDDKGTSRNALSKLLGLSQAAFNRRFSPEKQHLLKRKDMGKLLKLWPDVSKDWLLTGEGEPYKTNASTAEIDNSALLAQLEELNALRCEVAVLQAQLEEERQLTRKLTLRLLDCSAPSK